MEPMAAEFLNRVRDAIARTSALGRLSGWLEQHTTLAGRPYSFRGHEFQRAIIDSKHPNQAVVKPSQCGLSELSARLAVGFLAVQADTVCIYTLPTVHEALRFSKSRVDTVINGSRYLKSIMAAGNDSSSFKQIGNSQLFMAGTYSKALISIPTDLLVNDEVDFSSPEVLITAESRLSHSRFLDEELGIRGIRRKLSTPTVAQLGVSALFEKSDRQFRLARCKQCAQWFWPDFLFHVTVQGYDRSMDELTVSDVLDLHSRGLLPTARLRCPNCRAEVTAANLQPDYRQWVAECPQVKDVQGFQVSPFDLPGYHSPESLLRKRIEFGDEEGHFRNFSLGLPYASSANSVLPAAVRDNTCLQAAYPDSASVYSAVAGLDVGKTSYLVIAKPVREGGVTQLHVLWAEQIRLQDGGEDNLFATVVRRFKQFKVVRAVVDQLPYTDTIIRVQAQFPAGLVLPCLYVLNDRKLPPYVVQEKDWTVQANRTKVLDGLVKAVNTSLVKFAPFPDLDMLAQHLQGLKRVDQYSEDGSLVSAWRKTGPDHYFHSLSYARLAAGLVETGQYLDFAGPATIAEAFVGRQAPPPRLQARL